MSFDFWLGALAGVTTASLLMFTSIVIVSNLHRRHIPGPDTWTSADTAAIHALLRHEDDT